MAQHMNVQSQSSQGSQQESRSFGDRLSAGFEAFWKKPSEMNGQQQQQPRQQQQQRNQNETGTVEDLDQNGQPRSAQGGNGQQPEDPLAVYDGIWDNKPKLDKDGKPITNEPPQFKLDPKLIGDAASKINFADGLPEEIVEKMQTGAQLSAAEQQQILQHTGSRAYAVAMEHMTGLTDRYVGMRLQHEKQGLGAEMQKYLAKSKVLNHDAVKNNPKLAAHFEAISTRIAGNNPDKDPDWVADQAVRFFTEIGEAMGMSTQTQQEEQQQRKQSQTNDKGETIRPDGKIFDWDGYLK